MAAPKLSPSQKQFLNLYRKGDKRPEFFLFLRQQFKRPIPGQGKIGKRDFAMIDYLGRTIKRTLENYFYNASVKSISTGHGIPSEELGSGRILRSGHRVEGSTWQSQGSSAGIHSK